MEKYVYLFKEGNKDMRKLLGGKGANLAEMTNLGLPVPSGFTITTEACNKFFENNKVIDKKIEEEIIQKIGELELITGKKFGDEKNPLILSVRSGSVVSMPGMMDTILNLGLNDKIVDNYDNKRFIYDSYRRFIQMFSDVVKGYDKSKFEDVLDSIKEEKKIKYDIELTEEDMRRIVLEFKKIYKELSGEEFPQDPLNQLIESVKAVFKSWDNERANVYRKLNNIPYSYGTAVNVQEMVYGNLNENSGTGVAFSRNPSTGEDNLYGEYLINAQGEDVVAGIRTPETILTLKEKMPEIYDEFYKYAKMLEVYYKDMQDMEFTIENEKLYILQTRNGKRTGVASVKIAVDMVKQGLITKEEALLRVESSKLEELLHNIFDENEIKNHEIITHALAASPGAATGKLFFNSEDIKNAKKENIDGILVRLETSPEDIEGMKDSKGILTIRGGMTSHAAVVARGMGRCAICGASELIIDEINKTITTKNGKILKEGDYVSLDGTTGIVYEGKIKTIEPKIDGDFKEFMSWASEYKRLKVKANADNEKDALKAKELGAEGIGLCRTEHMFFDEERIYNFRKMIISNTKEERINALNKILPYQKEDFKKLFRVMDNYHTVIRYLDPPLHEFLPKEKSDIKKLSNDLNISEEELIKRIDSLKEFNPMMGHRGARLDITYPEIAIMQTKAIIESAIEVKKENINVVPEIMIPLIGDIKELEFVKNIIKTEADKIIKENNINIDYKIGTMIEVPRAVIISSELAKKLDFFSYGTNDLTQLTYGFSRDDSPKFLNSYYDNSIFETDPFKTIDKFGVGTLVKVSKDLAKSVNNGIELGVCGEHAGDPSSIEFFNKIGLDYVSCSPYRIPCAILSSAQAAIRQKENN